MDQTIPLVVLHVYFVSIYTSIIIHLPFTYHALRTPNEGINQRYLNIFISSCPIFGGIFDPLPTLKLYIIYGRNVGKNVPVLIQIKNSRAFIFLQMLHLGRRKIGHQAKLVFLIPTQLNLETQEDMDFYCHEIKFWQHPRKSGLFIKLLPTT